MEKLIPLVALAVLTSSVSIGPALAHPHCKKGSAECKKAEKGGDDCCEEKDAKASKSDKKEASDASGAAEKKADKKAEKKTDDD